jgi:hypothetical protein
MDDHDRWIRNLVYRRFVELGRAPTLVELTDDLGGDAEPALQRLHEAHALVLEPDRAEIRMANPFSDVPTPHRVEAGGRSWYGNCAWDAFGIPAACTSTATSRARAPTAGNRSRSRSAENGPSRTSTSSMSRFRPRNGGTTSSSPEAR